MKLGSVDQSSYELGEWAQRMRSTNFVANPPYEAVIDWDLLLYENKAGMAPTGDTTVLVALTAGIWMAGYRIDWSVDVGNRCYVQQLTSGGAHKNWLALNTTRGNNSKSGMVKADAGDKFRVYSSFSVTSRTFQSVTSRFWLVKVA